MSTSIYTGPQSLPHSRQERAVQKINSILGSDITAFILVIIAALAVANAVECIVAGVTGRLPFYAVYIGSGLGVISLLACTALGLRFCCSRLKTTHIQTSIRDRDFPGLLKSLDEAILYKKSDHIRQSFKGLSKLIENPSDPKEKCKYLLKFIDRAVYLHRSADVKRACELFFDTIGQLEDPKEKCDCLRSYLERASVLIGLEDAHKACELFFQVFDQVEPLADQCSLLSDFVLYTIRLGEIDEADRALIKIYTILRLVVGNKEDYPVVLDNIDIGTIQKKLQGFFDGEIGTHAQEISFALQRFSIDK